jgi:pimeloyl-ACP methyl ester carboxylesterase
MSQPQFEKSGEGLEKIALTARVGSDNVPYTVERPDMRHYSGDISDDVIVYVTGWTESEDSLKPLRRATAQLGMAAVTLYHPRYMRPDKVLRANHLRVQNVATVATILGDEYASVSLAGHSFGGIDVTRAAYEHELDLNVLALMGSAGLIQKDNFQQVAPRVLDEVVREEGSALLQHPIHEGRFAWESLKTIGRSPVLAAVEGISAATQYVGKHVPMLVERGIVTVNMMADGDRIFPHMDVKASTENIPFDITETFSESCHNFTYHRPREIGAFLIDIIEHADSLRAKRPTTITKEDVEKDLFGFVVS